ncbi:MAG TPA: ornithine cyclodeaminase family protein [Arthrobacter sp.]|uniref:ornithine cyclodeaminase family protein n=1 Tax=Arthrobacter sp. TaxID=1667 RepID=UPI002F42395E
MSLPYFDSTAVRAAAPWTTAIAALEHALLNGVDPEHDSPRLFSPAPNGEFLLMPASGQRYSGIKALTVAPANPIRGLEKIQGVYILFDSDTLAPLATMDGNELTAIRTPATTLLAVKHILASAPEGAPPSHESTEGKRVLVFGAGVQALNHLRAAYAVLPEASFAVVGRRPERVTALIGQLATEGIEVRPGSPAEVPDADVVICATSSRTPLFDGGLVAPGAVVAAVGQHGLEAREVDAGLVLRSDVVVEGRASALREAGDLIPARSAQEWETIRPVNLLDLVKGEFERSPGKPCLYAGVGMAWEDLATAAVVYEGGTRT